MAIKTNPLRTAAYPAEEAPSGGRLFDDRTGLRVEGCTGVDWRSGATSEERKEYSWYSDNPEIITSDIASQTRFLTYSTHSFGSPTKRWFRLYLYHLVQGPPDPWRAWVRVGVFNRASNQLRIRGAFIRPVATWVHPDDWRSLANMAALSLDLDGNVASPATYDTVEAHTFDDTFTGPGWSGIDLFPAPRNNLLHRIIELCIEPAGSAKPNYIVGAYTVLSPFFQDIAIPARGAKYDPGFYQLIWPSDTYVRYGLYRYSFIRQLPIFRHNPLIIDTPGARLPYLLLSDKDHSLGGDRSTRWEMLGAPGRAKVVGPPANQKPLQGNYPVWTEVELTFRNTTARDCRVQLWIDAMRTGGRYYGAVSNRSQPGVVAEMGLPPGNTAVIPNIRGNSAVHTTYQSSALMDMFVVRHGQIVTRIYRIMHGGGATLAPALVVDARDRGQRHNIGFLP